MVAEVRFYDLSRTPLEQAVVRLLTRAHDQGLRILLVSPDPERLELLDRLLWTSGDESFLPHGLGREAHASHQPILLCEEGGLTVVPPPNAATMAMLVDDAVLPDPDVFTLICELLDGRDEDAAARARGRWKTHKAAGRALTYWQQQPNGAWAQKG